MPVTNLPYDNQLTSRAKELRHDLTSQERKLWYDFLRAYPVKIYKQRIIESFIVDFYCASARLVIELDGSRHYTKQGKLYDEERSQILRGYGLRILRFPNNAVDHNFDAVCEEIHRVIQERL